jgi:branched-chain amino acid aminotransferase
MGMIENRVVYVGGEFVPWDEAKVHIMSQSFARGSAIFEVLSFHDTSGQASVFRLDEHVRRLERSAEFLDMQLPLSQSQMMETVIETVRRNDLTSGFIKIVCFYPQPALTILPPQKMLTASVMVVDPAQDFGDTSLASNEAVSLCISKWRKLDPQTVPVEAKASANYLNGMVARQEAANRGFDYAVLLDTQGYVAEGGTESIFIVQDGKLVTPATGTILQSITRKSILQIAEVIGIDSLECRLLPQHLQDAEEVFLAGTGKRVLPVNRIEERIIEQVPGPIAEKLASWIEQILAGGDDRFKNWLFPVSD